MTAEAQPNTLPTDTVGSGQGHPPGQPPTGERPANFGAPSSSGRQRGPSCLILPVVILAVLVGAAITYLFWYNDAFYVSTDNAKVVGSLIQVGTLNAGRVESLKVDVGSKVQKGDLLSTVTMHSVLSMPQDTPKRGFLESDDLRVEVRSPIGGEVVARQANVGDTVSAGQTLVTIVNPRELWVTANVEETKIGRVQRWMLVDVRIDALGKTFPGHVETITPATTATFSLLPQQNASGNYTRVTQLIPVKIVVDAEGQSLPLGGSASVRIRVAEPFGWLPWHP